MSTFPHRPSNTSTHHDHAHSEHYHDEHQLQDDSESDCYLPFVADFLEELDFLKDYEADLDTSGDQNNNNNNNNNNSSISHTVSTSTNRNANNDNMLHQASLHSHCTAETALTDSTYASTSVAASRRCTTSLFDPQPSQRSLAMVVAATASALTPNNNNNNNTGGFEDPLANTEVFDSALVFRPRTATGDDHLTHHAHPHAHHHQLKQAPRSSPAAFHVDTSLMFPAFDDNGMEVDGCSISFEDLRVDGSRSMDESHRHDSGSSFHSFLTEEGYDFYEEEEEGYAETDDDDKDEDYVDEAGTTTRGHENDKKPAAVVASHNPCVGIGKTFANLFSTAASTLSSNVHPAAAAIASAATAAAAANATNNGGNDNPGTSLQAFCMQWTAEKSQAAAAATAPVKAAPRVRPKSRAASKAKPRSNRSINSVSSASTAGSSAASSQRLCPRRSRGVIEPTRKIYVQKTTKDVLMGRGGCSNHHGGNAKYRERILQLQPKYKHLTRQEKTACSEDVMAWVHKRGGRFLKRDTNKEGSPWYIVSDPMARQKVAQALREDHSEEGKALKRLKYCKPKSRPNGKGNVEEK